MIYGDGINAAVVNKEVAVRALRILLFDREELGTSSGSITKNI